MTETEPVEKYPRYLLDSNVLLRIIDIASTQHELAIEGIQRLLENNVELCIVPQNLYETWTVMTRPLSANGLGKTVTDATALLVDFKNSFSLLVNDSALYNEWERLVSIYAVTGKPAHDTRLIAAVKIHNLDGIVTFNVSDFQRYEDGEKIDIVDFTISKPS